MKQLINLLLISIICSGCAPINTEFSCKATATDRCLSIEEVNAMSEAELTGAINAK